MKNQLTDIDLDLCEAFARVPLGMVLFDERGRVLAANAAACALLGGTPEALVGREASALLLPGQQQQLDVACTALQAQGHHVGRWSLPGNDGPSCLELSVARLPDGRLVAGLRDVAEEVRHQQEMRRATAELERRVDERTHQLREAAAALEAAEAKERQQIALDLHDDLGQILAAARIRLASLCQHDSEDVRLQAQDIAQLVERANRAMRSLAAQLAPAVLYELGLLPALRWLAEEVDRTYGMRVVVHDDGLDKPLSAVRRDVTYRVVRELLVNAARHARVDEACVTVTAGHGWLRVAVQDEGVGFDATGPAPFAGFGLTSVRQRLSFIGGRFTVESVVGDGTRAVVEVPLSPADQPAPVAPSGA